MFIFLWLLFRILQTSKFCGRALYRPRVSPRNRANPRPSYAKDQPRWGEKEFERNNVRETVSGYAQKMCTSRQKVTQIRDDGGSVAGVPHRKVSKLRCLVSGLNRIAESTSCVGAMFQLIGRSRSGGMGYDTGVQASSEVVRLYRPHLGDHCNNPFRSINRLVHDT